jgi:hypothetical protein
MKALAGLLVQLIRTNKLALLTLLLFVVSAVASMAGTDATVITSSASTAFTDIATLCVAIGTFFVVYRLVKKIA